MAAVIPQIIDYISDEIDNEGYERVKFIGDLTKGNASITIEDLRLDDSGVYKCEWTYYSPGPKENHTLVNLTITGNPFLVSFAIDNNFIIFCKICENFD